jgi:hypothetical protein
VPSYTSGSGNEVLPEGDYKFEIKSATLGSSKNGNEKIELRLAIEGSDQSVWDTLTFVPSSTWKIDQLRESYGDIVLPGEHVEIKPSELVGKKGLVSLKQETFEGRVRNKVASYIKQDIDELKMD